MIFDVEVKLTSDTVNVFSEDFWVAVLLLLDGHGMIVHQHGECIVALDIEAETAKEAKTKTLELLKPLDVTCTVVVENLDKASL